jgi:hypothetical protein
MGKANGTAVSIMMLVVDVVGACTTPEEASMFLAVAMLMQRVSIMRDLLAFLGVLSNCYVMHSLWLMVDPFWGYV